MTGLPASIAYLLFALLVVLAIAWLVIRFLSGIYSQRTRNGDIQVRSTYSLGTRQQLFVVQFRDKDYFLGVTPEQIQVIDTAPARIEIDSTAGKINQ